MTHIIRKARLADLDRLVELENRAFVLDRLSRRSIRHLLRSPTVRTLVAEAGDRIGGLAVILFRRGADIARLYSLAVDPSIAHRGIGRALLAAVEDTAMAAGRHALRLEVREDNEAALALYASFGYRRIGGKPGYYQDGAPAIIMERRFKELEMPEAAS